MGYDLGMMIEEFADAFIHVQGLEKEMSELKEKIGKAHSRHDEIFTTGSDTDLVKDIERYLHLTDTMLEARLVLDRHEKALDPVIHLLHNKTLTHQVNTNSGNGKTLFDVTVQENGRLGVTNIRKTTESPREAAPAPRAGTRKLRQTERPEPHRPIRAQVLASLVAVNRLNPRGINIIPSLPRYT